MKKLSIPIVRMHHNIVFVAFIIFFMLELSACKSVSSGKKKKEGVSNVSWNVVFKKGTVEEARKNAVIKIEDSVKRYYLVNYPLIFPQFHVFICPCDTLLYNINIKFVDGSGTAVTPPPPPKPGPGGSGDYVTVLLLANNTTIEEFIDSTPPVALGPKINLSEKAVDPTGVLAVIDTGIDTTVFLNSIGKFIWKESTGNSTMFNFLPGYSVTDLTDDHDGRHGTVVSAFVLQSIKQASSYPRIMVLKALDSNKRGSTFSVSCAMSYAIQKNASIINASLGYYGEPDSVLRHYIQLCDKHRPEPIPVFAAAGNTNGIHKNGELCNLPSLANKLGGPSNRLFFPACFSKEFKNLVVVTSLNRQIDHSCFYQNYSDVFVTLGVLNKRNCCVFKTNFLREFYEGTSFATPIASGTTMDCMIRNGFNRLNTNADWNTHILKHGPSGVTLNGDYIIADN